MQFINGKTKPNRGRIFGVLAVLVVLAIIVFISAVTNTNTAIAISREGVRLETVKVKGKNAEQLADAVEKQVPYIVSPGEVRFAGYSMFTNFDEPKKSPLKNVAVGLRLSDETIALLDSGAVPTHLSFLVNAPSNKLPYTLTLVDNGGYSAEQIVKSRSATTNKPYCSTVGVSDVNDFQIGKLREIRLEQKGIGFGENEFEVEVVRFGKSCK
jgi:hypothetical protein